MPPLPPADKNEVVVVFVDHVDFKHVKLMKRRGSGGIGEDAMTGIDRFILLTPDPDASTSRTRSVLKMVERNSRGAQVTIIPIPEDQPEDYDYFAEDDDDDE